VWQRPQNHSTPRKPRLPRSCQYPNAEYVKTGRYKIKDQIARQIVDEITNRNGRFLRKVSSLDEAKSLGVPKGVEAWVIAEDHISLEKTKQALRDKDSCKVTSNPSIRETGHFHLKDRPSSFNLTELPLSSQYASLPQETTSFQETQTMNMLPVNFRLTQPHLQPHSLASLLLSQRPHQHQTDLDNRVSSYFHNLPLQQNLAQQRQQHQQVGNDQNLRLQPLLQKQIQKLQLQLFGYQLEVRQHQSEFEHSAKQADTSTHSKNGSPLQLQRFHTSNSVANNFSDSNKPTVHELLGVIPHSVVDRDFKRAADNPQESQEGINMDSKSRKTTKRARKSP
jgi:hypothetical protein